METEKLIEKILEKLTTEIPTLNYVQEDWGQMDTETNTGNEQQQPESASNNMISGTGVLINLTDIKYSETGNFSQQGIVKMVIGIFEPAKDTQGNTATPTVWQLAERINKILYAQNFLPDGYGLPIRREMEKIKNKNGYYQVNLVYTIQLTDNTCLPVTGNTQAQPKIVTVVKPV